MLTPRDSHRKAIHTRPGASPTRCLRRAVLKIATWLYSRSTSARMIALRPLCWSDGGCDRPPAVMGPRPAQVFDLKSGRRNGKQWIQVDLIGFAAIEVGHSYIMTSARGTIPFDPGKTDHSRYRPLRVITSMFLLVGTLLVAGCGAGQDAQTSEQSSAVNGTHGQIGDMQLQNVFLHGELVEPETGTYGDVRLAFTIVNVSTMDTDRLLKIESPKAAIVIEAPDEKLEMAPGTRLAAGQPIEQVDSPPAPDKPISVLVTLDDSHASPGLTVSVDFTFERAGTLTLNVPFDVWAPGEMEDTKRPLPPPVTPRVDAER